ncbi:DUF6879 family protein [Micromonospora yangpuensis]|uniref:DUF6879 domain-containing protein n=1 Tax=Micromonospora yangpuensis TaxID=683228 RepID=A0A1C6UUE4_9ACTN|nr:DUF6879 family protein [Micromonospora yangpuensis]GGM24594.1 hypothetical protein GCM10012279_48730 [Micromonospora yangpuensis]SCL57439.1 hypothetical protein GA0070617_3527 [Micromonospora yangpuensis]
MHELFDHDPGELLSLEDYWADFEARFWKTTPPGFWKLERQQTFKEPGDEGWRAFADGRWEESLRVLDDRRGEFEAYYRRIAECGFATRRVRVVDEPLTPYLQWELHVLRLRHEYGGLTRVIGPDQVASAETAGPVPEIYTLGTEVMYEAVYDADGILAAARRWEDPALVARCQRFIEARYRDGEPLDEFFARAVAPLEPPILG